MKVLVVELNSWATHEKAEFIRDRAAFVSGAYEIRKKNILMG
jgi:hypothetical protein